MRDFSVSIALNTYRPKKTSKYPSPEKNPCQMAQPNKKAAQRQRME